MLIIRYMKKGVTQTTQIKQIFTDNLFIMIFSSVVICLICVTYVP
jgi:hypothetical protein